MRFGQIACLIGEGLCAGLLGTLAMSASQEVEMKLTGRPPSTSPADAAGKVLGVQPTGDKEKQRFSQLVHIAYGTSWGAVRGMLKAIGITGAPAMITHYIAVYATALVMLPALKVAPPVSEWGAQEITVEAWHHLVYAAATNEAFRRLDERLI